MTKFHCDLIAERESIYPDAIQKEGSQLEKCVGFIDCKNISMARPSGPPELQCRACYEQKRFHCFIYKTIITSDGLIFHIFGPEVGQLHDITLFKLWYGPDTLYISIN